MSTASDYVIVGAGPTGCALGFYLARRGATVTLVESVERPESVVGESMLPGSTLVFDECGLDLSGFMVKRGAVFCRDGAAVRFDFAEAEACRYPHAWQVQREVFDLRWRDVARRAGCAIVYADATAVDVAARRLDTSAGPLTAASATPASRTPPSAPAARAWFNWRPTSPATSPSAASPAAGSGSSPSAAASPRSAW